MNFEARQKQIQDLILKYEETLDEMSAVIKSTDAEYPEQRKVSAAMALALQVQLYLYDAKKILGE